MEEGGLDAVFFSIYVGQPAQGAGQDSSGFARAYAQDTAKFNAVHRLAEQIAPDRIAIAYTAADARRIYASGKKVAFMGVENGYGIGTDITRVKEFWQRGARYMSLAHNNPSQLSDSNTGEGDGFYMWGDGLSPLGKKVIAEMNKWGIMIDISHPSRGSFAQSLALSKAPMIASHSAVRTICDASRDLDDDQLKALARAGGVVQVVAFTGYVSCNPKADAARTKATADLRTEFGIVTPAPLPRGSTITGGSRGAGGGAGGGRGAGGGAGGGAGFGGARGGAGGGAPPQLTALGCSAGGGRGAGGGGRGGATTAVDSQLALLPEARRNEYTTRLAAINAMYPAAPRANVQDFVDHIDYAVKLIGIDHVGISSDFDGGGGIDGYNCALEAINVTKELVKRGYTEEQIAKIWSGNLLRVLERVEQVARQIQAGPKAKPAH
jgi:membrane dipeptidase